MENLEKLKRWVDIAVGMCYNTTIKGKGRKRYGGESNTSKAALMIMSAKRFMYAKNKLSKGRYRVFTKGMSSISSICPRSSEISIMLSSW